MQKQTVNFAVQTNKGVVQTIGKSVIYQPKTEFKGGEIKWLEDKPKKDGKAL